jgi:uncharacterized protein (TIGR02300 family)
VTRPELGVKRDCPSCGARFYDLNKDPAHCPKCAHNFTPEALLKPKKPRREDEAEEPAVAPKPVAEAPLEDADKDQRDAKSKRKPGMDDEAGGGAEDLADIDDIDIDIEDDDDTLLEEDEDDDDDDVSDIVGGENDDEA